MTADSKPALRSFIRMQKRQCSAAQLASWSAEIFSKVEEMPEFKEAQVVLAYSSLPDEVQTSGLISKWLGKKTLLLPVVTGDDLMLRRLTSMSGLREGRFGISEPTGELFVDYPSIDLAIVPGMAFDVRGNRLGRGKGYYDRFLPRLRALKLGVCFPFQLLTSIPVDPTDIPMDRVITV